MFKINGFLGVVVFLILAVITVFSVRQLIVSENLLMLVMTIVSLLAAVLLTFWFYHYSTQSSKGFYPFWKLFGGNQA